MSIYQNGTIYKIVCKDKDITDCYVGSTTNHSKRKSKHKSDCNNEKSKFYNFPVYRFIRDNGGWDNWEFVLLEDYPCNKKKQLNIRERYWFEKLNASLNSQYPERSPKEYHKEYYGKTEVKEQQKEYYNRPEVKQHKKEYNKEFYNRPEVKEYYKEYRKEYYKEYRNRPEVKERKKILIHCNVCNEDIRLSNKSRHEKSKKHTVKTVSQILENTIS
jgi:hypothetical protein